MTIVKKWRLMMTSFADIKTAIIEQGGTLPDGKGYNRYANAVRSIYSDVYTDEYMYPKHLAVPITNAINLVRWCIAIKEQIRQAIIGGGVECGTDIPLSQYGNKIREIAVFKILTTSPRSAVYRTPYEYQLEVRGGKAPYRWECDAFPYHGLTLSDDGLISGTPTEGGIAFYSTLKVTDAEGKTIEQPFNFTIQSAYVDFEVTNNRCVYDGKPHTATITPRCGSLDLSDLVYEVDYNGEASRTDTGMYLINIKIIQPQYCYNYALGEITQKHLYINQNDNIRITYTGKTFLYNGNPQAPATEVKGGLPIYGTDPMEYEWIDLPHTRTYSGLNVKYNSTSPPTDVGKYYVSCRIDKTGFVQYPSKNSTQFEIKEADI